MKKLKALVAIACMAFVIMMVNAKAFAYTGTGTQDDPIMISSFDDLSKVFKLRSGEPYVLTYVKLANDVTFEGGRIEGGGTGANNIERVLYVQNGEYHLDLAGHTILRKGAVTDRTIFEVYRNGEFYIEDSVGNGKIISEMNGSAGNYYNAVLWVNGVDPSSPARAYLLGGQLIERTEGTTCVSVTSSGEFYVYGGKISAKNGIGIDNAYGDVVINGGEIESVGGGRAINLQFTMNSAAINECVIKSGNIQTYKNNEKISDYVGNGVTVTRNGSNVSAAELAKRTVEGPLTFTFSNKPIFTAQPTSAFVRGAGSSASFSATISNVGSWYVTWHILDSSSGTETSWEDVRRLGLADVSTSQRRSVYNLTLSNVTRSMDGMRLYCQVESNGYVVKSDVVTISVIGKRGDTLYIAGEEGYGETQYSDGDYGEEWYYTYGYSELVSGKAVWQNLGEGYDNACKARFTFGEDGGTLELDGYMTYDKAGFQNQKDCNLYGIYYDGDLKIVLKGHNEIMHNSQGGGYSNIYGIYVTGNLTIEGDGTLTINMHQNGKLPATGKAAGIRCGGKLTVKSGQTYAYGKNNGVYLPSRSGAILSVTGGKLRLIGEDRAIASLSGSEYVKAPGFFGGMETDGSDLQMAADFDKNWRRVILSEVLMVTFDANGGSGAMNPAMVPLGEYQVLPDCGFTAPAGMEFAGWNVNGTIYATGQRIAVNGDMTAKAIWTNVSVTIKDMHRLYNPNSGEHFYTAGDDEKDNLVSLGWRYEGIAWKAPSWSNTPVYRLYNPNAGDHHYTSSGQERDDLVAVGWQYEGIGWYSDDAKGVGLHRLYNPNAVAGAHHYTTSNEEKNNLIAVGWKYEGIGWYGVRIGLK